LTFRAPSFKVKVFGTDKDRSAGYDFLLVIRIVTTGLSGTLSEINSDFCRKSQILPPVYLTSPVREFPLEFCSSDNSYRVMPLPYQTVEKVDDVHSFRYNTRMWRADRQSDGIANKISRAVHAMYAAARWKGKACHDRNGA